MSKNRIGKSLTYEEIGEKLDISPQQVHKIEKEAFNKIIKRLSAYPKTNIFEAILTLSEYFNIEPEQIYKKLDEFNYEKLCEFMYTYYGKKLDGYVPPVSGIEDFFS